MITQKMYRYLGRNGNITTAVKLEEINPIPMLQLNAEKGKILTNGIKKTYSVIIFEDEMNDWYEIEDNGQN
jgi:hypothetical protein